MAAKSSKLSPLEQRFCQEYVLCMNAGEAMRKAGYKHSTSTSGMTRLFAKPQVMAEIQRLLRPKLERFDITVDRVLQGIAQIAFTKITDVAQIGSSAIAMKTDIADQHLHAIELVQMIDTEHGANVKVKMKDSLGALGLLAKYLGLLVDRQEVKAVDEFSGWTKDQLKAFIETRKKPVAS